MSGAPPDTRSIAERQRDNAEETVGKLRPVVSAAVWFVEATGGSQDEKAALESLIAAVDALGKWAPR